MKIFDHLDQIVTLKGAYAKDGRNLVPSDLSLISNGCVVFDKDRIHWVGKSEELPTDYQSLSKINLPGVTLLPEIVDSHTHLIFGGDRAKEYGMRLNGATYQEIAQMGGGILFTSKATQQLDQEKLFNLAKERINKIHSYGVGTIEIKSGYGLSLEKEKDISEVIHQLKVYFHPQIQIKNTYLAAHAIPPEFKTSLEYMDKVVLPLLDQVSSLGIIDAVDIFHEEGYFSREDVVLLFKKAQSLGISTKIHADEFANNGGAILAANYQALSADHLLQTGKEGILALANSPTVATLLPGTGYFLGKSQAKARDFLDAGVKVAIASDYNPGSCHCDNLLLISSLAAPNYKLNQAELWASLTLNAAHALGLRNQGAIVPGLLPRFSFFKAPSVDHISYSWGKNLAILENEF